MTQESEQPPFDFDSHRKAAVEAYQRVRSQYEAFAQEVQRILRQCISAAGVHVASVDARAKAVESFADKAALHDEADSERPRYAEPLRDITDLAGVRVITFFPRTVSEVGTIIRREFDVMEQTDKSAKLWKEGRLGYQSVHYLVRLAPNRLQLAEYGHLRGLIAEIQVRTVLQHAWAEIEHDIQYKAVETIPDAVRRRFISLAGLIEIADREFQAIQDEDQSLRLEARKSVEQGQLTQVEITPDALKTYLDKRLGPDGRMPGYAYQAEARNLRQLGFTTLKQLDECIAGYSDDHLSRVLFKSRHGQLSRFEYLLLAGMGEHYIERRQAPGQEWSTSYRRSLLDRLRKADVPIRGYVPEMSPDA